MFWYFVIGALAAFGLVCAIWICLGGSLMDVGTVTVLCDGNEERLVRRYLWLRGLGLARCRMVLVNSRLSSHCRQRIRDRCPDVTFRDADTGKEE